MMALGKTEIAGVLGGAGLIVASTLDPNPTRRVAELVAGGGLVIWALWNVLKGGAGLLADNPVLGPGGASFVASWAAGVPGDIERSFQKPPPSRRPGESDEELNTRALEWLWEVEGGRP